MLWFNLDFSELEFLNDFSGNLWARGVFADLVIFFHHWIASNFLSFRLCDFARGIRILDRP